MSVFRLKNEADELIADLSDVIQDVQLTSRHHGDVVEVGVVVTVPDDGIATLISEIECSAVRLEVGEITVRLKRFLGNVGPVESHTGTLQFGGVME